MWGGGRGARWAGRYRAKEAWRMGSGWEMPLGQPGRRRSDVMDIWKTHARFKSRSLVWGDKSVFETYPALQKCQAWGILLSENCGVTLATPGQLKSSGRWRNRGTYGNKASLPCPLYTCCHGAKEETRQDTLYISPHPYSSSSRTMGVRAKEPREAKTSLRNRREFPLALWQIRKTSRYRHLCPIRLPGSSIVKQKGQEI